MPTLKFAKLHGLGNDFILINGKDIGEIDPSALSKKLCNRYQGIGADGLLLVAESEIADIRMISYNSDGSLAELCGNGIRCFSKYIYERGILDSICPEIETDAGVLAVKLNVIGGKVDTIKVNMGAPSFERKDIPMLGEGSPVINELLHVGGKSYSIASMLIGVPHTMIFVQDIDIDELLRMGPKIERHPDYPDRTNVNFVKYVGKDRIMVRTWQRGAGHTLACGTGSCASAVACSMRGMTSRSVDVELALGELHIDWAANGDVFMTGPAELVFEAEIGL